MFAWYLPHHWEMVSAFCRGEGGGEKGGGEKGVGGGVGVNRTLHQPSLLPREYIPAKLV